MNALTRSSFELSIGHAILVRTFVCFVILLLNLYPYKKDDASQRKHYDLS